MSTAPLLIVLIGWAIAAGSPGPATLAISGTSMSAGRRDGLILASGIVLGSATWGIAAAIGVGALMRANAWIFELVRYAGAAYLLYLALKSLKSAIQNKAAAPQKAKTGNLFSKGFLLHLTNPKAVLAWGSIYSIALPLDAPMEQLWALFGLLITTSTIVFLGYAVLFSTASIARTYSSLKRWFEFAFALLFGAASLKILTTEIEL